MCSTPEFFGWADALDLFGQSLSRERLRSRSQQSRFRRGTGVGARLSAAHFSLAVSSLVLLFAWEEHVTSWSMREARSNALDLLGSHTRALERPIERPPRHEQGV